jgi:CheY-like chemotaxis protein
VLIVDDDPVAARATARIVGSGATVKVSFVTDVDSALVLVSRAAEAPSAVILDFELRRGETGIMALMSLRAAGCDSPCAFHTGSPQRAREALESSRLGTDYPIFDKGAPEYGALVAWLSGVFAKHALASHVSGTRRRVF